MAQDKGTGQMGQRRNLEAECPDVDALGASQVPLELRRSQGQGRWWCWKNHQLIVIAGPREMDRLWVPQNRAICMSSHICTHLGQGALMPTEGNRKITGREVT